MGVLSLMILRESISSVETYETIMNKVMDLEIPYTILKFSGADYGIDIQIRVADEHVAQVISHMKAAKVQVRLSSILVDEDLCTDCGACISLCSTGALHFDEVFRRQFDAGKCVSCLVCLDGCPRKALTIGKFK